MLRVIKAQAPIDTEVDSSALDKYLLASFSQVDEVRQRKQRKLRLLARDIANVQNSLNSLIDRQERWLAEAASSEMAGAPISSDLQQKIQRAQESCNLSRLFE